jgi:hypothetical protein
MAKIRSDAKLYLTPTGVAAPPADVNITSVTKANPCVLTAASAIGAATFATFEGTGEALLDGKTFRLVNIAGSAGTLEGFDGTQLGAAVASGAGKVVQLWEVSDTDPAADLLCACLATVTIAGQEPDALNLDDMCTSTTVLGTPKPPTFQFTGWVDQDSAGFKNLIQASLESPKTTRYMLIDFGTAGGYIFGPVEIGAISVTAGVNAGLAFSGSGVFTEVPTYSWAL